MVRIGSFIGALVTAAAATVLAGAPAARGDEATIHAVAPVTGQGIFFEIGENRALFLGALHGTLYVESGADTLDGATLVCPASFSIDTLSPAYTADGFCTIGRGESDKIFLRWTCRGGWPTGCRGAMTITGGTGRFAGVTGDGEATMRTTSREFTDVLKDQRASIGVVRQIGSGLITVPALRYRLP